jgi:hypothetical protein
MSMLEEYRKRDVTVNSAENKLDLDKLRVASNAIDERIANGKNLTPKKIRRKQDAEARRQSDLKRFNALPEDYLRDLAEKKEQTRIRMEEARKRREELKNNKISQVEHNRKIKEIENFLKGTRRDNDD